MRVDQDVVCEPLGSIVRGRSSPAVSSAIRLPASSFARSNAAASSSARDGE